MELIEQIRQSLEAMMLEGIPLTPENILNHMGIEDSPEFQNALQQLAQEGFNIIFNR